MLNILQSIPPSLERFSSNFEKVLGKHQLKNLQVYLLGLSLELKRKNLQSVNNSRRGVKNSSKQLMLSATFNFLKRRLRNFTDNWTTFAKFILIVRKFTSLLN